MIGLRNRQSFEVTALVLGTLCLGACDEADQDMMLEESAVDADGKADAVEDPEGEVARAWLRTRSGAELAEIFSQGTATHVPTGDSIGGPVLANGKAPLPGVSAAINWFASGFWGGKTLTHHTGMDAEPLFHDNGDPVVTLTNKVLTVPENFRRFFGLDPEDPSLLDVFDAEVTLNPLLACDQVADGERCLEIGDLKGEPLDPPSGTVEPYFLSLFRDGIAIDDKPSVTLNYYADDGLFPSNDWFDLDFTIGRILDEVREVDEENCPGLWLGRAHIRHPIFQRQWRFWTYFTLDFGRAEGQTCDLGPLADELGIEPPA